jgi:hypothetical protein
LNPSEGPVSAFKNQTSASSQSGAKIHSWSEEETRDLDEEIKARSPFDEEIERRLGPSAKKPEDFGEDIESADPDWHVPRAC